MIERRTQYIVRLWGTLLAMLMALALGLPDTAQAAQKSRRAVAAKGKAQAHPSLVRHGPRTAKGRQTVARKPLARKALAHKVVAPKAVAQQTKTSQGRKSVATRVAPIAKRRGKHGETPVSSKPVGRAEFAARQTPPPLSEISSAPAPLEVPVPTARRACLHEGRIYLLAQCDAHTLAAHREAGDSAPSPAQLAAVNAQ